MKNLLFFYLLAVILISACNKSNDILDNKPVIIPIDSFTGYYHMIGTSTTYNTGWPPITTNIDDTILVSKLNDSTLLFGNSLGLIYYNTQPEDFYLFFYTNNWNASKSLEFHKPYSDDSAFYSYSENAGGQGGTNTDLTGVKIY